MKLQLPKLNEIPRRRLAIYAIAAGTTIVVLNSLNDSQALTPAEYVQEGQAICADMGEQLSEQFERFASDPESEDDVTRRASEISASALQQLIDLDAPNELGGDRDAIVSGRDDLQELQRDYSNGQIELEVLQQAAETLELEIDQLWPGCSRALNPEP